MARGSSPVLGLQGFAVAVAVAALLVVAAAPTRCAAQAPAPATSSSSGCTASILSLAPCLSFTAGSTSSPGASCCSALAGVVRGAPRCLCAVLGGGAAASFGVTVNATRALELPGKCKVTTPPVSQCNAAVGAPTAATRPGAGSASPSASAATAEAPTAPPPAYSTTGAGSKATPATGAVVSSHSGIAAAASVPSVVAIIAFASMVAF